MITNERTLPIATYLFKEWNCQPFVTPISRPWQSEITDGKTNVLRRFTQRNWKIGKIKFCVISSGYIRGYCPRRRTEKQGGIEHHILESFSISDFKNFNDFKQLQESVDCIFLWRAQKIIILFQLFCGLSSLKKNHIYVYVPDPTHNFEFVGMIKRKHLHFGAHSRAPPPLLGFYVECNLICLPFQADTKNILQLYRENTGRSAKMSS